MLTRWANIYRFLKEFYRDDNETPKHGQSRPKLVEVLNEPLYHFIDGRKNLQRTPKSIFEFHNVAAKAIRRFDENVLIGGPTMAFPIFEERNFARWDERMKLFIDTSAESMDFYALHFYDFNERGGRGRDDYKGARIEATFDMIEQYTMLKIGEVKPYVISEYGGRDHSLENRAWTSIRDWHFLKAATPLFMSFLDRPNLMLKTIPFVTAKAEWGRRDGVAYNRRLLHQAKERPGGVDDDWIFTDLVMYFQLWADVEGTRVSAKVDNPDVLAKSYVNGKKAYVILSNLNPEKETVSLKLFDSENTQVESIEIRHLCRVADAPVLDKKTVKSLEKFTLAPEASVVIEYTFSDPIALTQKIEESKFYATSYNKPIEANQPAHFEIKGVKTSPKNEAILRVGFGREKAKSRQPKVTFNGAELKVPTNYAGGDQSTRPAFFGLLEIPVQRILKADNKIEVIFPDSGGRVSTVTLKHFAKM